MQIIRICYCISEKTQVRTILMMQSQFKIVPAPTAPVAAPVPRTMGTAQIVPFPSPMLSAPAGNFWHEFETRTLRRNRRGGFWLIAVAAHIAVVCLFLISIDRPAIPMTDSMTIDLVAPPRPAEPVPPKKEIVQEAPKPKPVAPHAMPRVKLQIDAPQPVAPVLTQALPPPQEAAPATPQNIAPPAAWLSELYAHLDRNKRYSRTAQQAHIQGTAMLRFTMNRQGKVLSYKIEKSSGHAVLDDEVTAMIERAQPLPPLPEDMADQMEFIIPVQFSVR